MYYIVNGKCKYRMLISNEDKEELVKAKVVFEEDVLPSSGNRIKEIHVTASTYSKCAELLDDPLVLHVM